MSKTPFVIQPALVAVAVAYPQGDLIADLVLPRVTTLTELFRYQKYSIGDAFRAPDTRVGRKSAPNQLTWESTEATDSVQDHGLDCPVPNSDLLAYESARQAGANQVGVVDPKTRYTKLLTGAVLNRREKRAADLVFNAANYATANKATLSGTSQWSDFTNSDPLGAITDALDSMVVRANHSVMGLEVWSKLSRHPKTITRLYGSASTRGSARLQDMAEELGLEAIHVGKALVDTAAPGQASSLARCWGKHASFFYRNMEASLEGGVTFGMTAQWGGKVAGEIIDPDIGLRGGVRVRSGESVKELLTANDLAFGFFNAVA